MRTPAELGHDGAVVAERPKPRAPAEPRDSRVLLALLAGGALLAIVAAGACANPDGVTPACNDNTDDGGMLPDPKGCSQFAYCGAAGPAPCCVDADGGALTGNDLASCFYGYGGCLGGLATDATGNYTCLDGGPRDQGADGGGDGGDGGADGG